MGRKSNNTHPSKRQERRKRHTHKREGDVKMESEEERWIYKQRMPRISRSLQKPGAGHEEIFPSEPTEETKSGQNIDSRLPQNSR